MNTLVSRRLWNVLLACGAVPACFAGLMAGCKDKETSKAEPATEAVPPAAPAVEPPPAVVAEDPTIPLHESIVGTAPVGDDYFSDVAPPEPLAEDPPAKPEAAYEWIPGYWWWSRPLGHYVWITGAWRNPPPEQVWSPGAWIPSGPRFVWSPGFWAPRGFVREVVEIAPPPVRAEVIGVGPGGSVWMPGYYAYRGGGFGWVPGSWGRPPFANVGWVEPRWAGCGGRYYFQPGRWDYGASMRGTAYLPVVNVHAGVHVNPVAAAPAVVAAQARFTSAAATAIAHGGTRTPNGGFTGGGGSPHGGHPGPANGAPLEGARHLEPPTTAPHEGTPAAPAGYPEHAGPNTPSLNPGHTPLAGGEPHNPAPPSFGPNPTNHPPGEVHAPGEGHGPATVEPRPGENHAVPNLPHPAPAAREKEKPEPKGAPHRTEDKK